MVSAREAVWKHLGLHFYNFTSEYIRTRKYKVRTGAGLTAFLEPGSGVLQGGAEGLFLYLLVTHPTGASGCLGRLPCRRGRRR